MPVTLPALVYTMCFVISAGCALLLGRAWQRTGVQLLGWSALCFALLSLNNLFVIIDLLLVPQIDFSVMRLALSLAATVVLLFGFIWHSGEDA